jgi:ribosome-binding ATPase YchF (GTP1/OBG family)
MEVGVIGKPNVGKSTFFNALTLLDVPVAPYPFTTVKANRGVAAVRYPCPHSERGVPCTPGNAACRNGTRWIPVNLLDVPGLVPGAHAGKGLGHQFLDDLRATDGFLHVVDLAGATTAEGALAPPGTVDPAAEVAWLEEELIRWVVEILSRDFERHARSVELEGKKPEEFLQARLTGLSIPVPAVLAALRNVALDLAHPSRWTPEERFALAREILRIAKPRIAVANKADKASPEAAERLAEAVRPVPVVPSSAEAELTLRRAQRKGWIDYEPGASSFRVAQPDALSAAQRRALDEIAEHLRRWGSTGVQQSLEELVFRRLGRVVVFPVEDEAKWTDSRGRVLPDAFLVPEGSPVRAVAFRVHTELGENFVRAIDARTHRALAADHPVAPGAILRIVARR